MKKVVTLAIALFLIVFLVSTPSVRAEEEIQLEGAKIFQVQCAGCHPGGGNIIRRGKNLKQRAMRRNGMDSIAAVAEIVTNGKNNMSAFSDRLTPSEIEAVSAYVLDQAATGWR
ncbi:MAG: c-type cytochrome [Cyanobacteriota bacterium]|nr:c-type cytochrome [Cyanobacteriota bacterium]